MVVLRKATVLVCHGVQQEASKRVLRCTPACLSFFSKHILIATSLAPEIFCSLNTAALRSIAANYCNIVPALQCTRMLSPSV
jgi:hypothetical protein